MWIAIDKSHPFQTLILEDDKNILYLVNIIGYKLVDSFIKSNKDNLIELTPKDEDIKYPNHFNNACSIWMSLPWDHDIYRTIKESHEVYREK